MVRFGRFLVGRARRTYNDDDLAKTMIITIDGPAGAGKSTIAARLAGRLKIAYLDTGAMYRSVTLAAIEASVSMEDTEGLGRLAGSCRLEFVADQNGQRVLLDGRDVTERIRQKDVTAQSHKIANAEPVRKELVRRQRQIAESLGSLVTEGRDQGTAVFPDADFKIFLDASAQCRAKRRADQLQQQGVRADYQEILTAQQQRDSRDQSRRIGPLKIPSGAIVIDTTEMDTEQVVRAIYEKVTTGRAGAE